MATTNFKSDARSYFGGKGGDGVFQTIINEIPSCDTYWELFAGNASIYRNLLTKAKRSYLLEKDYSQARRLADSLGLQCFSFDFFAVNILNRSMYKHDGTFVVWGSAFNLLELKQTSYDFPSTFIYADPPYPKHTYKGKSMFSHELTNEDHQSLLSKLLTLNSKVAICTYPNEQYSTLLSDWRKVEYTSVTRAGKVRLENAFFNYDAPKKLLDTSYIGKDYREREAYKKQQRNWLKNFAEMHPHQQQAIIQKLNNHYNA